MMTGIAGKLYVGRAMRALPFTLRQLEVFASLCATRSFRRTAEALGISQASVSNQINALENQLGVALFDRRRGRKPTLTAMGNAFHDDLQAFRTASETLAAYRQNSTHEKGLPARYRVLIGQGTLDRFVRPKLDAFVTEHPQIELIFETRTASKELARDIANGRYDLVLVHRLVSRPAEPELRQIALLRGGIYGHRKFGKGRELPLSCDEISALPFVMPITYPPEDQMLGFYAQHGIRPLNVVGRTQHLDVALAMVSRGVGVYCLADHLLPTEMQDQVTMLRPLENWRLMWYRKEEGPDPRGDAVEAFLKSNVLGDPGYRTLVDDEDAG